MGCASSKTPPSDQPAAAPVVDEDEDSTKINPVKEEPKPAAPAASTGNAPNVLLENGEINFKPVHSAVRWNKPIADIEKVLINLDAVNCPDPGNGNTPIHIAAQNGHNEIVKLLISKGVTVDALNGKGNTALHMAIGYDYYDAAKMLMDAGAKPDIINEAGFPASRGLEGDKTLGLAALACAKTTKEAQYALELCESHIDEVIKLSYVQIGLKTKKSMGSEWTEELQEKFKAITKLLP